MLHWKVVHFHNGKNDWLENKLLKLIPPLWSVPSAQNKRLFPDITPEGFYYINMPLRVLEFGITCRYLDFIKHGTLDT